MSQASDIALGNVSGAMICFTLGAPTKTLNQLRAMGFRVYAKHRRALAVEVAAMTCLKRLPAPLARARVRIERHGPNAVDHDGLVGGTKVLLDVLQPYHATQRPDGLGFIASDAPSCLSLEIVPVRSSRAGAKTIVQIFGE
jgi:hypothetical protein